MRTTLNRDKGRWAGCADGGCSFVLPVTLTLLTVLFAGQRFGTRALGRLFGPSCPSVRFWPFGGQVAELAASQARRASSAP